METLRYFLGVLVVVMVPPAVIFWYLAHPLVGLWRRVGPWVSYVVLFGSLVGMAWGCWLVSDTLMGRDLGTNQWTLLPGIVLYVLSIILEVIIRKQLTLIVLIGVPELVPGRVESKLLRSGIYGRVRHPRYMGVLVAVTGFALISNYSGAYLVTALTVPGLYVLTVLEERELLKRFGDAYRRYREEVPRFLPRRAR